MSGPVLTTSAGKTVYTEGINAFFQSVRVDAGLTLSDPDWVVLPQATCTITVGNTLTDDHLSYFSDDNLGISITGISNNGRTITLSGYGATVAQWQAALSHVTYSSTDELAASSERTVSFSFTDASGTTATAVKTLVLQPSNDLPGLAVGGVLYGNSSTIEMGRSVQVLADGHIVVAGTGYSNGASGRQYYVTELRLNADGSTDTSFAGGSGLRLAPFSDLGFGNRPVNLQLQADGKLLVWGSRFENAGGVQQSLVVARYTADGLIDTSFGSNGVFTYKPAGQSWNEATQLAVLPSGRIVIAGTTADADVLGGTLLALTANGQLDAGFGNGGVVFDHSARPSSVTVLKDGQLLVGEVLNLGFANGYGIPAVQLSRYSADGRLDTSFGDGGQVHYRLAGMTAEQATTVMQQPDGKLLVVVQTTDGTTEQNGVTLMRLNANGALDTGFAGGYGMLASGLSWGEARNNPLLLQSDGKLLLAGIWHGQFAVLRYNADGSPDAGFGKGGMALFSMGGTTANQVGGITLDASGKIVLVGSGANGFDGAVARLNADGSVDTGFGALTTLPLGGSTLLTTRSGVVDDIEGQGLGNFAGATLVISREGGANAHDLFQSLSGGQLGSLAEGANLVVAGQVIGKVLVNHGGTLSLSFTSGANYTTLNQALTQISYANSGDAAGSTLHLGWTFTDASPDGKLATNSVHGTQLVKLVGSTLAGVTLAGTAGADSFRSTAATTRWTAAQAWTRCSTPASWPTTG